MPTPSPQNSSPEYSPRVLKNFGLLLGGRVGAAVFTVMALAIMARELGVETFGLVILVHTYVLIVNGIFSTKAFEAIVKYGLPAHLQGNTEVLKNLFSSSYAADVLTAVISCVAAIALAPWIGGLLGSDQQFANWMQFYGLVLLFAGTSTAKGILRLYDRFAALGLQLGLGPLARFLAVVIAWQLEWGATGFLVAWGLGYIIENLILHYQAWRQVSIKLTQPRWVRPQPQVLAVQHQGFWPFVGVTYVQGTLDLLPKQIATLLSGLFLGTAAAGLFRVAREIATIVSKPALLLRQAIFTDLTRLWEDRDPRFKAVPIKTALLTGAIGVLLALLAIPFGSQVLLLMFGDGYQQAHGVLVVLLLAASMELATSSLHMAAYAMNKAVTVVVINVIATLVYLTAFALLTPVYGLIATGWAACLMAGIALLGAAWLMWGHEMAVIDDQDAGV